MELHIAYKNEELVNQLKHELKQFPLIELVSYSTDVYPERKKAFKLKGGFGARKDPFGVLFDTEHKPIIAFYSETNDCTCEKIIAALKNFIVYDKKV